MTMDLSKTAPSSVGRVRHFATASSQAAPCGAWRRPRRYSKVVSSGAIRPARAPPSMLMLQIVIRCSMFSARMASPRNSKTWPVPPPIPIRAIRARMMSFALTPGPEAPVHAHLVGLRLALEQRLGGEDHLDLAGPDPERQRAERPVRGRVRVTADDRHAGLREPQLRADDVDDALGVAAERVDRDAEVGAVRLELPDLRRCLHVDHREAARGGRRAVVRRGDRLVRAPGRDAAGPEAGEGLGAGDLVDEVEVDGEDGRGARVLGDDVLVPDLLDEGARSGHRGVCSAAGAGRGGYQRSARGPRRTSPGTPDHLGPGRPHEARRQRSATIRERAAVQADPEDRRAGPWGPAGERSEGVRGWAG